MVSVPPPLADDELVLTSDPPQAAVPNSATAVTAAHSSIGVRGFMVVSLDRSVRPPPRGLRRRGGWTRWGATEYAPRPAWAGGSRTQRWTRIRSGLPVRSTARRW